MWSAFTWMSRSISHKQAIAAFKESPEYKQNLKKLKEDTLLEMERTGQVKRKMNGKRCGSCQCDPSVSLRSVLLPNGML
jgi:hypothetical protein